MSKKRRIFDIDMPDVGPDVGPNDGPDLGAETPQPKAPDKPARRGPMASAISENAHSLRDRQAAEARIREENDKLAQEFVRLKREGLIIDRIPLDAVVTEKLLRDRKPGEDEDLGELRDSIREIGLSNPIRVETRDDGRYELIQGMRRLMAFRALQAAGEPGFDTIPAGIVPPDPQTQDSYRRMVDENLVRRDISFAEMATLARRYAADPRHDCTDVSEAVAVLFKSASYVKRSYIRAFAELLHRLEKVLEHPQDIPRNVGVELKRRIDNEPSLIAQVSAALRAEPRRDAAREVEILRGFTQGEGATLPTGKTSATKAKPRKPKTTFQVALPEGIARCNASQGRLELRDDRDFSAIDRRNLERAVAAFYAALDED